MSKLRSPGLLIRISHLILIQILFVFAALALLFFYPQSDSQHIDRYTYFEKQLSSYAARIDSIMVTDSLSVFPDKNRAAQLASIIAETDLISDIELILPGRGLSSGKWLMFGSSRASHDSKLDTLPAFGLPLIHRLVPDKDIYLAAISKDGGYSRYIIPPVPGRRDYAIILKTPSRMQQTAEITQGHLLLLLFLIATLISLLIMNLIAKGIKKPLDLLIEGLEETASGNEHHIPEDVGDEDIRRLTVAFNDMSRSLAEKRAGLSKSNEELLRVNKSLIESESILTALVDYSPDAIIVTDLEDQVIIYNQEAAQVFGFNQTNMMGRKISNILPLDKLRQSDESNDAVEIICRRKDGSRFPAMLVHTPLGPEANKPMAMLYFIKSISESENYQEMILKLDRIASRGKMARDIAHEINNYLAVLQGNVELLPMLLAKNDMPKVDEKLSLMKKTVGNISTFTEGLSRFSDENSEFSKEDLNQLIENLLAFLKPQNKFDNIYIGTNLADNLPMVAIDAGQIQLLIVNILSNSAEALAESDDRKWIVVSTSRDENGRDFYLKFADSGPGIPEDYHERLFISRFSTRRDGNGLGLITCKNIVDNHQGEISYHKSEESKAIFIVKLPIEHTQEDDPPTEIITDSERSVPAVN